MTRMTGTAGTAMIVRTARTAGIARTARNYNTIYYNRGQDRNKNTRFITPNYRRNNGRERFILALNLIAKDIKVYLRTGHR
jgi:hypothetical protein